jgi:hypothetical protein
MATLNKKQKQEIQNDYFELVDKILKTDGDLRIYLPCVESENLPFNYERRGKTVYVWERNSENEKPIYRF